MVAGAEWVLQGGAGLPGAGPGIGILGLIILILNIYVTVRLLQSHKTLLVKIVWILVVWFLPGLGLIIYFFLGREKR